MNSKKVFSLVLIAAVLLGCSLSLHAFDLEGAVSTFSLTNGMKWIVVNRPQAPVFSGVVMVRVGGADEDVGKTGLAHMFEHMAFKGSDRIGTKDFAQEQPLLDQIESVGGELTALNSSASKDSARATELETKMGELTKEIQKFQIKNELWEILLRNGASDINAYTSKDLTTYFMSMPIDRLDLWAHVIADMVFRPVYREFYTERKVVAEERRSSVENDPDGMLAEMLVNSAYENGPYHWSTIGFEKDVRGLTIADARAFHSKYYVPSNMVGVLVGDLSADRAKKIVAAAFGGVEGGKSPVGPSSPGDVRSGIKKVLKRDARPSVVMAYHKPTLPNPDEYTFDVIEGLMCNGRSSRLKHRLLYEKKIAKEIYCTDSYPGSRLANLFFVWIEPVGGVTVQEIEREVNAEFAKLRDVKIPEPELKRVRKQATADLLYSLEDNLELAQTLARFETLFGDWKLLPNYPSMIGRVEADDVMGVAKKFLIDSNSVIIERVGGR